MSNDTTAYQACEVCFAYALTLNGKCLNCYQAGREAVNRHNIAVYNRLPALSPLHETFRSPLSSRGFKRTWTSK